ncbi:MAG: hypothetical protein R3F43_00830 [bacterium]
MPAIPEAVAPEVRDAFMKYTDLRPGEPGAALLRHLAGALQALILLISGAYVRRSAAAFGASSTRRAATSPT